MIPGPAGTQGQRLHHIAAAAHAVQQYLDLIPDRVSHGRQQVDGRGRAVQVVPAVVGDREGGDAGIHCTQSVGGACDALGA